MPNWKARTPKLSSASRPTGSGTSVSDIEARLLSIRAQIADDWKALRTKERRRKKAEGVSVTSKLSKALSARKKTTLAKNIKVATEADGTVRRRIRIKR